MTYNKEVKENREGYMNLGINLDSKLMHELEIRKYEY